MSQRQATVRLYGCGHCNQLRWASLFRTASVEAGNTVDLYTHNSIIGLRGLATSIRPQLTCAGAVLDVCLRYPNAISVCDKGIQLYLGMDVGTATSCGGRHCSVLPVLRAPTLETAYTQTAIKVYRGLGTLYKASTE